jgi:DME family drug/metabolite transporter
MSGVVQVLLACVLWGTAGIGASFLPGISAAAVGSATSAAGGLAFFLIYLRPSWRVLTARPNLGWVIAGSAGMAGYPLLFYAGLDFAPVATCYVVSLGSAPIWAALLELVVDRQRQTPLWLVGTGIGLVGVAMLVLGSSRTDTQPTSVGVGITLALAAGLAYSLQAYSSRKLMARGASPLAALGALFGGASIVLVPVMIAVGGPLLTSWQGIAVGVYLAALPICLAYVLFFRGLRTISASLATTLTLADPAAAALLSVLVLGQVVTPLGWVGIGVIAAGVVLASRPSVSPGWGPSNRVLRRRAP